MNFGISCLIKAVFYTTFRTLCGRYSGSRMSFGITSVPEEFQRKKDKALEVLNGKKAIHDVYLFMVVATLKTRP